MAVFNVTIGSYTNLPASQIGDITIYLDHNETHIFTEANFTTETSPQYSDPEGDQMSQIKITALPSVGVLYLDVIAVLLDDLIDVTDINNSLLTYVADAGTTTAHTDSMTFDVVDSGSLTEAGLTGTVNYVISDAINLPPNIVGDGSATIDYGATLVFTGAMFTSGTTPAYSDPEGDNPAAVKILTLPDVGILYYNSVPVYINQVITIANIDAGLLTYVSDLVDTDGDSQTFTFAVSDTGSSQFTE